MKPIYSNLDNLSAGGDSREICLECGVRNTCSVYLDFDEATALCQAITAHINAEYAKAASEKAKAEWEATV